MFVNRMRIKGIIMTLKFVYSEPRWSIIKVIGNDKKTTSEIRNELIKRGIKMSDSSLYYHLSNLEQQGIIEMVEYLEKGGGAPEKSWQLKVKKICVDLLSGELRYE